MNSQKAKLQHILNLAGKRIIPAYFREHNKENFDKWGHNACRQTAAFSAFYLNLMYPDREIVIKDCTYECDTFGHYDHAHVYMFGYHNRMSSQGLLVDVARVSMPTVVKWSKKYLSSAIDVLKDYDEIAEGTKLLGSSDVKLEDILDHTEYFTGKTYRVVCEEILQMTEARLPHRQE